MGLNISIIFQKLWRKWSQMCLVAPIFLHPIALGVRLTREETIMADSAAEETANGQITSARKIVLKPWQVQKKSLLVVKYVIPQDSHIPFPETKCITVGGADPGKPCLFPFKYGGVWFNGCTSEGKEAGDTNKWCSTKNYQDGEAVRWGNCDHNCNTHFASKYCYKKSILPVSSLFYRHTILDDRFYSILPFEYQSYKFL